MNIKKLTKKMTLENIDELIQIDLAIKIDEHWSHENFLTEAYGKWDNSYVALKENTIIGFIICSIKNENTLHIHRFAVEEKFQNMEVGTQLITRVINSVSCKIKRITLKVKISNIRVQNYYNKFGFKLASSENKNYVYERLL